MSGVVCLTGVGERGTGGRAVAEIAAICQNMGRKPPFALTRSTGINITTKWLTGAPQHSGRFRDWNTTAQFEVDQFEFSAPEGARKLETIAINDMGELMVEGVQ